MQDSAFRIRRMRGVGHEPGRRARRGNRKERTGYSEEEPRGRGRPPIQTARTPALRQSSSFSPSCPKARASHLVENRWVVSKMCRLGGEMDTCGWEPSGELRNQITRRLSRL